jgi:hypothetical protein
MLNRSDLSYAEFKDNAYGEPGFNSVAFARKLVYAQGLYDVGGLMSSIKIVR